MKNILLFYQPIADLVIEFLEYESIYLLQKKGIYNTYYYKEIIYNTGSKEFEKWIYNKGYLYTDIKGDMHIETVGYMKKYRGV